MLNQPKNIVLTYSTENIKIQLFYFYCNCTYRAKCFKLALAQQNEGRIHTCLSYEQ